MITSIKFQYGLLLGCLLIGCSFEKGPSPSEALFRPFPAKQSGVMFRNDLEYSESFNIIEYLYYYNGGGLAVGDINNDGLEDLYFSANIGSNKLYLNRGDLQFEDITEKAGLESIGAWKTGVSMADVNADGLLDIYLCRVGNYKGVEGKNELYINNGDLTFKERAKAYGLDFSGFSTQSGFLDYDRDGDLDMYLLNHSVHSTRSYGKATLRSDRDILAGDCLYQNNDGLFSEVTHEAGIHSSQIGYGLGLSFADVNLDGWPDIYVSNDFHENDYLYLNNQDGTFTESIHEMIGHTSRFSMGNSISDLNGDGYPEIMTLDMLPDDELILKKSAGEDPFEIYRLKLDFGYEPQFARNSLQLNNGDGTFSDVALMYGIAATDWSWSPLIADYDQDGYNDIFITNGIVKRPNDLDYVSFMSGNNIVAGNLTNNSATTDKALVDEMPEGKVVNRVYKNIAGRAFEEKTTSWLPDIPTFSTAAVYADLDQDGDLDIVINNINEEAHVYENIAGGLGNYLSIVLKGNTNNPFAVGTKVRLYAGGKLQVKELFPTKGFQSSGSYEMVFGLGAANIVDSVVASWPDGRKMINRGVRVNQRLILQQDEARSLNDSLLAIEVSPYFTKVDSLTFVYQHQENSFVDFNREPLMPHVLSRQGPKLSLSNTGDLYIGGASGQSGSLFSENGAATVSQVNKMYEETNNLFFDADNDGDDDLLIITGGNEHADSSPWIADLLLINESGTYSVAEGALPNLKSQSSVAINSDFDLDGDDDLFIGGRVMSGRYGLSPSSYLLVNDGSGRFSIDSHQAVQHVGMVTDAAWVDLDGDGFEDLIVVGEWMKVTIFKNDLGTFKEEVIASLSDSYGWWNCIVPVDVDGDGDLDFVLGNEGLNNKLKPSVPNPIRMYVNDFDGNGYLDQVITYSKDGKEYPVASRDELARQMPMIKKSFTNYRAFSGKTVYDIFGEESLSEGLKYHVNEFASVVLMNEGNFGFNKIVLPNRAQISPIYAVESLDVNTDGIADVVLAGNRSWANTYFGASDGNHGLLLIGNGNGEFETIPQNASGFKLWGDVRDIEKVSRNGEDFLLFGVNNGFLQAYQLNKNLY